MKRIAEKHENRLQEIKQRIEEAHAYFQQNVERYHEFVRFVFYESINQVDRDILNDLGKPTLEFNILEAYISRLRGEFSRQQPSLTVRAADGVPITMLTEDFSHLLDLVEAHLRAIFFDASNDKLEYNIYSDLLAGGYSVMEVYTDYVNDMSFEQNINIDRVFDPTLCGFDPTARESHKGDGQFCFQMYPRTREQFEQEYGAKLTESMNFVKGTANLDGFGWSYKNQKEDIVLVCDYFEKKKRKVKIVKLTNGHTVTKDEYEQALVEWEEKGILAQPPMILEERWTSIESICRYRLCENKILDYRETDFKQLPLVFVDGNSVLLNNGEVQEQVTRPYVYHAKGVQQLKNFAGQTLANELENLVQHKFIVALESIDENYKEAYQNIQKADTLVYRHFFDKQVPEVTLPPPREVQRTPIPPEVTNTFKMSDEMTQAILGSYDASLGINNNQLSGRAIQAGAMQSNSAAMPYIIGYIKGLNRVAQIITDLIPKYYRTPRSLPILLPNGQRSYEIVNKKGSMYMNYDPNSLQIKVSTGVNFAMQKEVALQTITQMMQSSPAFADFINTKGLNFILDNLEIRGIDQLKVKAEEYERELAAKQQQQSQVQMQMAQQQMQQQQAKTSADIQRSQADAMRATAEAQKEMKEAQGPSKTDVDLAKLQIDANRYATDAAIKEQDVENRFLETISKIRDTQTDNELERERITAENARTQVSMLESMAKLKETQEITNEEEDNG